MKNESQVQKYSHQFVELIIKRIEIEKVTLKASCIILVHLLAVF